MKTNYLIVAVALAVCILLCQTGCQEQAQVAEKPEIELKKPEPAVVPRLRPPKPTVQPPPAETGPRITFDNVAHDFGEVGPGTRSVCELNFSNSGDALLTVNRVQTCCGIRAELKDGKKEYAPGQTGAVSVTYTARGYSGSMKKNIYVLSDDKTSPRVGLTLSAQIVPKVRYEPAKLSLLLRGPNAGAPDIRLTSVDGQAFAVKSFKATGNCMTAPFDPLIQRTEFVLTPKVDVEKAKRSLRGYVRIGLTHPKCDTVVIPFNALPRFKITPNSILVRDAEPARPIRRDLWILSNYDEDFGVESTSTDTGVLRVLSQERVDKRWKFVLEIMPPDKKDRRFFADVFHVKIEGGEELKINCRGFYSRERNR